MPLTMIDAGVETTVKQIHGRDQTRRFLQNLGFVEGAKVMVVSSLQGQPDRIRKRRPRCDFAADGVSYLCLKGEKQWAI